MKTFAQWLEMSNQKTRSKQLFDDDSVYNRAIRKLQRWSASI